MIVACGECNGKVSTSASRCPHCGAPMGQKGTPVRKRPGANRSTGEHPEGATTVFILGLLSIVICGLLGPFAWIQGNDYERKCRAMKVQPEGMAVAGKVLGMIVTILMGLGVAIFIPFLLLVVVAG